MNEERYERRSRFRGGSQEGTKKNNRSWIGSSSVAEFASFFLPKLKGKAGEVVRNRRQRRRAKRSGEEDRESEYK